MIRFRSVAVALLLTLVAGCATGPAYNDVSGSFHAVSAGSGRIYFYRIAKMGAAVQPDVKLNGQVVGKAVPEGFFFVDRPAGDYTVTTTTEVKKSLTFHLDPGQVRYVRLDIAMGFFAGHVYPELVDPTEAKPQLERTKWTSKSQP
jgi:Protein of unknown function (DUF2846)